MDNRVLLFQLVCCSYHLAFKTKIDVLKLRLNVINGVIPSNTENRILFSTQQWGNGSIYNDCAIGSAKESNVNGLYGGARMVFYTLGGTSGGCSSPELLERMRQLENELLAEFHKKEKEYFYEIRHKKVLFEKRIKRENKRLKYR